MYKEGIKKNCAFFIFMLDLPSIQRTLKIEHCYASWSLVYSFVRISQYAVQGIMGSYSSENLETKIYFIGGFHLWEQLKSTHTRLDIGFAV